MKIENETIVKALIRAFEFAASLFRKILKGEPI